MVAFNLSSTVLLEEVPCPDGCCCRAPSYLASHLTMGTSALALSKPWFSPYLFPSGAPKWMPVESRTARKIGKLRLRTAHGQRTWDPTRAAEDEGRERRRDKPLN